MVRDWDSAVRAVSPPRSAWCAHLLRYGDINSQQAEPAVDRRHRLNKDLPQWLERVRLPYHSPHKSRPGHATYSLNRCRDVTDLKAVNQNLMHSSLQVTDSIYSVLSEHDVGNRIAGPSTSGELMDREATFEVIAELGRSLDQLRKYRSYRRVSIPQQRGCSDSLAQRYTRDMAVQEPR